MQIKSERSSYQNRRNDAVIEFFVPNPESRAAKQEEFPSNPTCTTVLGCFVLWLRKISRKNGDSQESSQFGE